MKRIRTIIIGVICIGLVVGYYYYLNHKSPSEDGSDVTEVQKIVLKDLEGQSYPATPREVIKLYNRILCCYYNEEYTEEEFRKLADQAIKLMDEELADNNPPEQYYQQVEAEVEAYRSAKRTINNASVCDTNDVEFQTIDGAECACVTASYFVRDDEGYSKTAQEYILRKDQEGKWKILAFQEGVVKEDE
ncbi:MAG: hypothetical protein HFI81_08210 [Eubacterium sp.]|jgi:hypothetical protein|nr:hypothetical protein [Eubacterium sp.]